MSPEPLDALEAGTRLIHIGPQKTGTTSIQLALFGMRQELEELGVYYPKGSHRRRRAAFSLGLPDGLRSGSPIEPWQRLVKEVARAGDARVCVSNEDFARASDPAVIEQIVRELGGGHPVHVVLVARRLDLFLPSQWQERVKGRVRLSWEDWLGVILGEDDTEWEHRNVWLGHDLAGLARRWLEHVEPSQLTVVVTDEQDRTQQTRVFEQLLGLPPGTVRSDPTKSNRSLTLAETELVRAINVMWARAGWSHESYRALVAKGFVLPLVRQSPTGSGPRSAVLPDWAHARVRELSDRRVEELSALPSRIIGDLGQLLVPAREPLGEQEPVELAVPVERIAAAMEEIFAAAVHDNEEP